MNFENAANSQTEYRTNFVRTLASKTSALCSILTSDCPCLATDLTDVFVLLHEFILRCAPGGDDVVQILRGGPHGFDAAPLLARNIEPKCLAVTGDGKSFPASDDTLVTIEERTSYP